MSAPLNIANTAQVEQRDADGAVVKLTQADNGLYQNYDPEAESMKYGSEDEAAKTSKSVVSEFIKQLRPGLELYRVSVPAFILQPISLLEKLSIYSQPTAVLHRLCSPEGQRDLTTKERMLLITTWSLSTWKSIPRFGIQEVKPFNPILGEEFHCEFDHADEDGSKSVFVAEQVRHHPPVSAFHLENKARKFKYYGWVYPKTVFGMNSFTTNMEGSLQIELGHFGETYKLAYPPIKASGIIFGTRMIYMTDALEITCAETGFKATIRFSSSNKDNVVDGEITDISGEKVFYRIKGVVNGVVRYKDVDAAEFAARQAQAAAAASSPTGSSPSASSGHQRGNSQSSWFAFWRGSSSTSSSAAAADEDISTWDVLYDCAEITAKKVTKNIQPLTEQPWNHSRRVWHLSAKALRSQDFERAQAEKNVVEQAQRDKKIDEDQWQQTLFKLNDKNDWVLAAPIRD